MTLQEAMRARHMVRKYTDKPLPKDIIEKLNTRVAENNKAYGLDIILKVNDSSAYQGIIKLLLAKGVNNYFIMAGNETAKLGENLGYAGADLMLYAQTLGLNTWWAGATFSHKNMKSFAEGKKVLGVVAVGYGATQGVQHKMKAPAEVSSYNGQAPKWFNDGVEAALLAPTALNKLAFFVKGDGDEVEFSCNNGMFTGVDSGLIKYHFELGAGKENFHWKQ